MTVRKIPYGFYIRPENERLRAVKINPYRKAEWLVAFNCRSLNSFPYFMKELEDWLEQNCKPRRYRIAQYFDNVIFKIEEDAMLCYLAFC